MTTRNNQAGLRIGTAFISLCSAWLCCGTAHAQQSEPAESNVTIEEIVVTAQKREQKLIDVPISVSVLGADAIA